jgi:hypothetical protein
LRVGGIIDRPARRDLCPFGIGDLNPGSGRDHAAVETEPDFTRGTVAGGSDTRNRMMEDGAAP